LQDYYRKHPYVIPNNPPAPDPLVALGPPDLSVLTPADLNAINAPHREFLDKNISGLPNAGGGNWWGARFLATGTFATVGMWEHDGRGDDPPRIRKVVVKEINDPADNLLTEGLMMNRLWESLSDHIVRLLSPRLKLIIDPERASLGPEWRNVVRHLVMEYCPQVTLLSLLERREKL